MFFGGRSRFIRTASLSLPAPRVPPDPCNQTPPCSVTDAPRARGGGGAGHGARWPGGQTTLERETKQPTQRSLSPPKLTSPRLSAGTSAARRLSKKTRLCVWEEGGEGVSFWLRRLRPTSRRPGDWWGDGDDGRRATTPASHDQSTRAHACALSGSVSGTGSVGRQRWLQAAVRRPLSAIAGPPALSPKNKNTHSLESSSMSSFFWHPVAGYAMLSWGGVEGRGGRA